MAKKRRDKERDPSSIEQVAKVGKAALSLGIGAASFTKKGYARKLTSEVAPALIGTTRAIKKDVRNIRSTKKGISKRLDIKDLESVYKSHLKENKTFKKQLKENAIGKKKNVKLNIDGKNKSIFGQYINYQQVVSNELRRTSRDLYRGKKETDFINNQLTGLFKNKNTDHLREAAFDAFAKIEEFTTVNSKGEKFFSPFIDDSIKRLDFDKKERQIFLEKIWNEKEKIIKDSKEEQKYSGIEKNIKKLLEEKLMKSKKQSDTTFGKLSSLVKKVTNKDVDLEMEILNSRGLTVGEFLETINDSKNKDMFDMSQFNVKLKNNVGNKNNKYQEKNIIEELTEYVRKNEDFKNVLVDDSLRIGRDGQIFDTNDMDNLNAAMYRKFSSSTLGSLFWQTDVRLGRETPILAHVRAGLTGSEAVYEAGNKGETLLKEGKVMLANGRTRSADLYEVKLNSNDELVLDMNPLSVDGYIKNNKHGKMSRANREVVGSNRDPLAAIDDEFLQLLDIGQSGSPTLADKLKSRFSKGSNSDWIKNIIDRTKSLVNDDMSVQERIDITAKNKLAGSLTNDDYANQILYEESRATIAAQLLKDTKEVSSLLNDYTAMHQIDSNTITSLLNSTIANDNGEITNLIKDEHSRRILQALSSLDDMNTSPMNILSAISAKEGSFTFEKLYNKDLENIINRGLVNTDHIIHMQNISQLKWASFINNEATNVMEIKDIIRRESMKEVLLRETAGGMGVTGDVIFNSESISSLEKILSHENLTKEQANNLRYVANWGVMQSSLGMYNDTDATLNLLDIMGPDGTITKFENLMKTNPNFKAEYKRMLDDMSSNYNIFDAGTIGNINENYADEFANFTYSKKSALHIDNILNINSINDAIKLAGQAKNEILAGRHDLENYTTLTQIPQFMVSRLSWGLEDLGLGFSNKSTSSTLEQIKSIALKRVLPVAAALSIYDYMDYESENFTGVSMTGAAANTLSNFDIASRKLAYSTGVGQALDWFKESSIVGEYWTGTTDYQTAEEREEWYENGYQAVRGGRFWGIGSTSEFRGSAIQYYQPNYLKRAHSNWKEIGIYGDAEEKFSHSWLPSLRHPLSPLKAAFDPYWLEKKNMEDRPYPMTGKMFSEGTPWGAVLNPTIGEILKPVRTLPEVRRRLGNDGRDIRSVVEGINERIKNRANENDDMLIIKGTDIRNASYIPYASPNDGSMNITFRDGMAMAPGIGYMEDVSNLKGFVPANGEINGNMDMSLVDGDTEFEQAAIGITQELKQTSYDSNLVVNDILSNINKGIKNLGAKFTSYAGGSNSAYSTDGTMPDLAQGTYVYQNLVNQRKVFNSNYYADNYDYKMLDRNIANNYMRDFTGSVRELSGIYNFLGGLAFGEDSWTFELENANNMTSFSRHFWDSQAGGVGGEFMEIARRFFASEDKSRIKYNPLKNSMEEWLPSRFLTDDPYTELPKGEMRLPGKGFESIHDLHPDQFGEYGAFDRMKILGDVAPTSEEYKIWRNIARNTISDENLMKQMDDIEHRAQKMSSKHEFYDYRYYNNNLDTKHGIVKSWNKNVVTLSSGEQLRLGGINLTEEADLSQVLTVGQKIHYSSSKDAIKKLEDGIVTNAVIYEKQGAFGTNINKSLVDMGMAERDDQDKSAIGYMANASSLQQSLGMVQEMIGHANIPFVHNKFLNIETARESYKNEHVYGTTFATWDHPIKGFVQPMLNQTFGQSMAQHALAVGSSALYFRLKEHGTSKGVKFAAGAAMATANPSVLLGMGVEFINKLGVNAVGGGSNSLNIERGAKIGSVIGTIGWGLANAENPLKATASFAIAGETISTYLKAGEHYGVGKGALIGAGIGLAVSAIKNPGFSKEMFRSKWIPKDTEKKYEMDEYFDRLEYIKNKGLYEQASLRAGLFEGNHTIKAVFRKLDKNKEKIGRLTKKAEKLSNKHSAGGYEYEQEMLKINEKIMALQSQQTAFKGGKYTKAAVAYKKAMDSTIYGMSEGATPDEILSSVPVQYKDHFKSFIDERSKSERKKILKELPEYLRKPLQIAWGENVDKIDSNGKFFKKHELPSMAWKGWKPSINLKHVKMKTIQNEGMLLSNFGYYDSEKSKMEYHMAPDINNFDKGGSSGLSYMASMTAALSGVGMTVQNITVEPTSAPGLWIVGDIKQTAKDIGKIGDYAVNSGIQTLTSLLF